MTRSILIVLATMMVVLGSAPSFAISDREYEKICSEPGNVDPRCFLRISVARLGQLEAGAKPTTKFNTQNRGLRSDETCAGHS
jgi:hypothetical protein